MEEVPVQTGIEVGAECTEARGEQSAVDVTIQAVPSPANQEPLNLYSPRPPPLGIPETSYSSSEDEDFYDATEYMGQSPTLPSLV